MNKKEHRPSPIARELNPEHHSVGDTQRFPRSIGGGSLDPGDPIKQYGAGRICAVPECEARLSRYNPNDTCAEHPVTKMLVQTPKVVRIDSAKLRKIKGNKARKGKKK